jgi:hypothetical protein
LQYKKKENADSKEMVLGAVSYLLNYKYKYCVLDEKSGLTGRSCPPEELLAP